MNETLKKEYGNVGHPLKNVRICCECAAEIDLNNVAIDTDGIFAVCQDCARKQKLAYKEDPFVHKREELYWLTRDWLVENKVPQEQGEPVLEAIDTMFREKQ